MQRLVCTTLFTLMVTFLPPQNVFSQTRAPAQTVSVTRVEFMTVGVSHEMALSKKHTVFGKMGLLSAARSAVVFADRGRSGINAHWYPVVDLQYRMYTNLTKRAEKGRPTAANSGNYLAFKTLATLPEQFRNYELDDSVWLGPIWGMQRQLNERLNIDFAAGLGYQFRFGPNNRPLPLITLNLGYRLSK